MHSIVAAPSPGPDIIEITYQQDSSPLMARLLDLPFPVFLDSCAHSPRGGRFDILSCAPIATVVLEEGAMTSSVPIPPPRNRDLFSAASYLLERFDPGHKAVTATRGDGDLPFAGGLLGMLGYPRLTGPGEIQVDEAFIGVYPWALVVDHQAKISRLAFQQNCPEKTRLEILRRIQSKENISLYFNLLENFSNNTSKTEYADSFERIASYIDAGDCYQINLTQRFSSRFQGHPFVAYQRLRQDHGKPFSAYLQWHNRALLSLSPERFIQVQDRQVTTQPIKGTRPRGNTPEQDRMMRDALLRSEKDRAENLMIVDLLRNDLGTVCEFGSIRATTLFELQAFDNVFHLVSTISGRLPPGISALTLLQNCFPGGSITGAPKIRAMEIIEELEKHAREAYCGSVFHLGFDGNLDSSITIRSLLCRDQDIYCWAGGGIVADSDCQQEYRECFDKISSLIDTLQAQPEGGIEFT